ncbi:MAG: hypothetical protein ACXVHB_18045 [Solirubrobacteraceae bacterium]
MRPAWHVIRVAAERWRQSVEHAESRAESTDVENDVRGRLYGDRARTPRR